MKIVFLDRSTLGESDLGPLEALGELVCYDTTGYEARLARVAEADVVITNKVVIDAPLLDAAPKLKLVLEAATGVNNIDAVACKARGVAVANVAGYSTEGVLAHTFALYFTLAHRMRYFGDYGKNHWFESDIFTHMGEGFHELSGKRWGIIGMGAIGQRVAQVATAFGAQVAYTSTSGANTEQPYEQLPLEALLENSDVISIHAPLNEKTKGLIDATALGKIKSSAWLLNLGRGPIVDEAALAEALQNKRIAGAGLDVLGSEPPSADNPLFAVPNDRLVVTPHIAWASKESRDRLVGELAENLKAFVAGQTRNRIV
jgi:glycerate dehydrogenase